MTFDISKHGDNLEREYSGFIKSNIPNYEIIWAMYIGNDGNNILMPLTGLSPQEKEDREFFAQYSYTALESFICIYEELQEVKGSKVTDDNKVKSLLKLFNHFLLFWAHIGRFKDNIENIQERLKHIDLISALSRFYEERNQVLHDRKIPYIIIDQEVMIPQIETVNYTGKSWGEWKSWFDMDPNNYRTLSEYLESTFLELHSIYNSILSKILDRIKTICSSKTIKLVPIEDDAYKNNMDSSGSADWKAYISGGVNTN